MLAARTLLIGVLMLTAPLVGCIGDLGDDAPEDLGTSNTTLAEDLPPTAATFHAPTGPTNASLVSTSAASVFGPGVDTPVGALQDSGGESFEPTIGVTSDGSIFLSTFGGSTGQLELVTRSQDGGHTWEDVTPHLPSGAASFPPNSNDPYVHVDQDTDRVFLSDLQALVCSTLAFSDDGGQTWTTNPVGCGQPFGVHDHQTVFTAQPRSMQTVGYENVVYYCVNRLVDTACATSLDGGVSFGPLRPVVFQTSGAPEGCGGLTGHGVGGPDGRVYLGTGGCGMPVVAMSEDDGVTWTSSVVSEEIDSKRHDVELATDAAGNVYAMWISEEDLPYIAVSTDQGASWSDARMVAHPSVSTSAFFSIAAGDEGRIAFLYMGTDSTDDIADMDGDDAWNGYIGTMVNATDPNATIATVPVNDPGDPLARGPCDDDNRCDGIGDFLDIVIGADGRPWASFVDVCNDGCVTGDENEGVRGLAGTISQGPALRGPLDGLAPLSTLANDTDDGGNATTSEDPGLPVDAVR